MMRPATKLLIPFLIGLFCSKSIAQPQYHLDFDTPYGNNPAVGKYVEINGAKIYYEEYGQGEPLMLIHGNGGNILTMGNQIDFFRKKYRVIAADSRGQGKSELKTDSLTYSQIADDLQGLANHLKLDTVSIIGWSDGGIIGLMMGMNNNLKINKIVSMAANLRPDSTAVYPWVIDLIRKEKERVKSKIIESDKTEKWEVKRQLLGLVSEQPSIKIEDLSKIKAKVLIMAADEDVIRNEHSIEIYENIREAQLCIMPGETHLTPITNPELFNSITSTFLSEPFKRPRSKNIR